MSLRILTATAIALTALAGPLAPVQAAQIDVVTVTAPLPPTAPQVAFTPGNLVVLRMGNGAAALSNASAAVFLDEYTPAGVLVQSVPVPTTAGGGNGPLTLTGNSTTEGGLGRSADGQYLVLGGYYTGTGQTNPGSSVVTRTVARVDSAGVVDSSTVYTDTPTAALRGMASNDGAQFWAAGGANALRYLLYGNTGTSTQVMTAPTNLRQPYIYNGQLYLSSGSSPFIGISTIGTGLPTTPNQPAVLQVSTGGAGNAPNGFLFLDRDAGVAGLDTLYVANQTAANGLQKYSFDGSTWTARGNAPGVLNAVTGYLSGTTAVMYVVSGTASSNLVMAFTDSAAFNANLSGSFSTVATAGTNTAFRGLAFAPGAVGASPALTLTKQASVATLNRGELVTYTVALKNTGTGAASGAMLTDTLPAETDFAYWVDQPAGANVAADEITWTGNVAANATISATFAVTHTGNYGEVVTNTAQYDHSSSSGLASAAFTVNPATPPNLSILKDVSPSANVPYHGVVTYTVIITNSGQTDAAGTLLTDTLPSGVAFGSWIAQNGASESAGQITWNGLVNAAGSQTFVFIATHTGNYEDVITNTATYAYGAQTGSDTATFGVVSAGPALDITKSVTPVVNAPYGGLVTYTIHMKNLGLGNATGVILTDVLPISTTFAYWVAQPSGASESGGTLTWTGDVSATSQVDFSFAVTQTHPYGAAITNTAEFAHASGSGNDGATFNVEPLYAVTLVYRDPEDAVFPSEVVRVAGSFNGWDIGTALTLTSDGGNTVFTGTLNLPAGTYDYKYIVVSGGDQWDWLNTNDRSVVVTDNITVDDYRNVVVGWANLEGPATQTVLVNTPTGPIAGQVYIQNVTNPAGSGRGVLAQVGYGNSSAPAMWAWSPTVFDSQVGNNDVWRGTLTPTASGVFSFATRFDGNWGVGNPNAAWAYGDLDGSPFSLDKTGVLTVTNLKINQVQGATHYSPYSGTVVGSLYGIVTAKHTNGFYAQDPNPDADARTSEGVFFFNSSAPAVNLGDAVYITGTVVEFISGSRANDLPLTEISNPGRSFRIVSSGNPLPAPTLLGNGGLPFPNTLIADARGPIVPGSAISDTTLYGMDFYESLEGMRIQINDPVAVGPTTGFSETVVVADGGVNATGPRSQRGGLLYTYADPNPERLMLDDEVFKGLGGLLMPMMHVSATIPGPVIGVMDYQFSNYRLQASQLFTPTTSPITQETTSLVRTQPYQLLVAGFNVENLAGTDTQTKFDTLADFVVNRLSNPDILSLQEIQDNNGATNDGTVTATLTISRLVTAITAAGGPAYQYREVTPENNQDGGAPGSNIRVGFLFRTDRGVTFVDRPGAVATTTITATVGGSGVELSFSPGRIDPTNTAFSASRKPLVGEFLFNGQKLFVIGNHFNSKSADQPLWGRFQPPTRTTEMSRTQQALAVNLFVSHLRNLDPNVNVVVLGDINDFEFSPVMTVLKGDDLTNLHDTLPPGERYSYVFEGNSQSLDHILVSNNLAASTLYDPVHASAEFAANVQVSDHDPDVALLSLPTAANFNGSSKSVNTANAYASDLLTYTLTLSNSGETAATYMLTDVLPAGVTLVSGGGLSGSTSLTGTGTLAANTQATFVVVVQVSGSFTSTFTLSNTATLLGDGQTRTLTAPGVVVQPRRYFFPLVSKQT